MTIAYNSSIPNPPNDPADDVSIMQSNAAAISSIIAIDHVGFNVAGSGQHNQVTFNANNVPSVPTSPPVLFTNTMSGTHQLYFYSGNAAHSSDQYYLSQVAGSGQTESSTFMLGGLIIKTGSGTNSNTNTGNTISFYRAFPNGCLTVVAVSNDAANANAADTMVYPRNWNASNFNLISCRRTVTQNFSSTYSYIAIGY